MALLPHDESQILAVPNGKELLFIPEDDIMYCLADGSYTMLVLFSGKKITITKTIGLLEKILNPSCYCRVHQSHIINIRAARIFLKGPPMQIIMDDGKILNLARKRKQDFMKYFEHL